MPWPCLPDMTHQLPYQLDRTGNTRASAERTWLREDDSAAEDSDDHRHVERLRVNWGSIPRFFGPIVRSTIVAP
jgi:hypothetical protein